MQIDRAIDILDHILESKSKKCTLRREESEAIASGLCALQLLRESGVVVIDPFEKRDDDYIIIVHENDVLS